MYIYSNNYTSKYNIEDKKIIGVIKNIKYNDNKTTLEILEKERIICIYYNNISLQLNDTVEIKGTINEVYENTNFNLFNYKNYLKSKKINYSFKIDEIKVIKKNTNFFYKIKNNIIKKINDYKSYQYLNTFILGNKNYLEEDVYKSYQINGVSHLLAISGMHVSFLVSAILFILNKIKKTNINYYIVIIFLLFYSFLTDFSPSILRSFLLFTFVFINKQFKLNIKNEYILLLIAIMLLIYNPFYIYNLGFVFSFTISMFLICFGKITNKYNNYFLKLFITSLISTLASIPISINNFNYINLLGTFNNLIFVPFVTFIIFPLSLVTLFIKPLDSVLLFLTNILDKISLFLANYKIEIILCTVPFYIIILYYIIIIFILKRNNFKYLIILFIVLFVHTNINYISKYSEIHMIDIGQGDCFLIKLKNNKGNVLIDTGGSFYSSNKANNVIIPYLKSNGIKKIDYLIITHGDIDHIGEAKNLINNYKIDNILLNSGENNIYEQEIKKLYDVKNVSIYDFYIKNYEFNLINSKNTLENEDSLVLYTKIDNYKLLFIADIGIETEKKLLDEYNLKNMDILKVGHHGSKYSSGIDFLKVTNPKISLISAGRNNRFNHPNEETLKRFDKLRLKYLITSINGNVIIKLKNDLDIYTRF